jgi:hypothetical protein
MTQGQRPPPDADAIMREVLRAQDLIAEGRGEAITPEGLEAAVTRGVVGGIKALARDPEFVEAFWKSGYEHLTSRVGEGATQWVGKKLLLWAGGVMVAAGLYMAGKAGLLK